MRIKNKRVEVAKIYNLPDKKTIFKCLALGHKFTDKEKICISCGAYEIIKDPQYPFVHADYLKMLQTSKRKCHYGEQFHAYLPNYASENYPQPQPIKYKYMGSWLDIVRR